VGDGQSVTSPGDSNIEQAALLLDAPLALGAFIGKEPIPCTGTATITVTNSGNTYFAPAFATQKLIVK
jgi:hypothetical protein